MEVKQNCLIRCKVAKYNSVVFNKLGIWIIHCESKKGCHPDHGYNFVNS